MNVPWDPAAVALNVKLGGFPKPKAPLGNGGSFRWPKANDGRKRLPAPVAPLPKAGVEDMGEEVTKAFLLPVKASVGVLWNKISEVLLLVVKPWSGSAFCCRPCW